MASIEVFETEWNRLTSFLLEADIRVMVFYVPPSLMPEGFRRVVYNFNGMTTPVEVAPWLPEGKFAFEAYRNEVKADAVCSLPEKE